MVTQPARTSPSQPGGATPVEADPLINATGSDRFTLEQLLSVLDVRGDVPPVPVRALHSAHGGVLGGQQVGQQIVLAERVTPGKVVHSLNAIFFRPGNCRWPVWIDVERLADGRSVGALALSVRQDSQTLSRTNLMLRTRRPDPGIHRTSTPLPVSPEAAEADRHLRLIPWETRLATEGPGYRRDHWSRIPGAGDDPTIWRALLAHACEFMPAADVLAMAGLLTPTGEMLPGVTGLVLSMTVTFHDEVDVREWLLYRVSGLHIADERAASRIEVFTAAGELRAEASVISLLRQSR
ncbi:acyl-CoA thioesterase domain-containing protein [Frankia sp. R82]|uniref:acyl-CoA thioesterase n=1 Tax=Frankia sp. R82 TaxID=2950553 RepID=UPI002042E421|nr:acyl-CoA thioesterase domain-containing protein [Frankia sp. R82]MCM3883655.1 thioesterase family protein [Frankia sp. R82]